jgi:hypothetical protein
VQDTNPLGGAILTDLSVDLTVRSVVATIRVTESDASRAYRLRLHDVEGLRVDRPDVGWDNTEVTEVHVSEAHTAGRVGVTGSC